MTEVSTRQVSLQLASSETALQVVVTASSWVLAAKRTRSAGLVAHAEQDLQTAVDDAREAGVQWGQIGSILGIARGNAYQRYRKKLPDNNFQEVVGSTGTDCLGRSGRHHTRTQSTSMSAG